MPTHKHRTIPNHSIKQAATFFALISDLGHDSIEAKERAAKKYKHNCFNDLTSSEINILIGKLEAQKLRKEMNL